MVFNDGSTAPPPSLRAATDLNVGTPGASLTQAVAEEMTNRALALWSQLSAPALPSEIHVRVADIPAGILGWASGRTVTLDINADGAGWYTDLGTPAAGRVDLLTVVSHEIGHLLGYGHSELAGDLMAATLPAGARRLPGSAPVMTHELPGSAVTSPLLLPELQLGVALDELVDHPLLANERASNVSADSDLWLLPLIPMDYVDRPQQRSEAMQAKILRAITDEETELLDEELLDLIAAGQK